MATSALLTRLCGLGLSLLLHGSLILPWALFTRTMPARTEEPVLVTVVGIVSGHQVEAEQPKQESPPIPPPVAPRPPVRQKKPVQQKQPDRSASPSALHQPVEEAEAAPAPPEQSTAAAQSGDAAPVSRSTEVEQVQQTVQPRSVEMDLVRKYVASLSKAIQNKLIYPGEAREMGYIGSTVIAFTLTEEGEILPGSLRVKGSSGFPMLDEAALRAARASVPFAPPPARMDVAITVSFAQR